MYTTTKLLEIVNKALAETSYDRKPQRLYEPAKYVMSLGGKRIRPVLMLMAYNLYHEDVTPALKPALGLETYHNFTLLHDDLMDGADVRRGKPCVHKVWDDTSAILSGDNMLVMAFHMMQQCATDKLPAVLKTFTETALEIDEGQQYDILFETRADVKEDEYIEMIRLKTSVLLACALKIGAILADAPEADADALYAFGEKMGLAFQLQDDYLDVYGDYETFGKKIGGDILCNKKTYMLINALEKADTSQRTELDQWLEATDCNPEEKIAAVTRIYDTLQIPQMARQRIDAYTTEALSALDKVALSNTRKEPLRQLALGLLSRQS